MIKSKRENFSFMKQLSIWRSKISITFFDEPLVRLYHNVVQYYTLQVDVTGSITAPMPCLKNVDLTSPREFCFMQEQLKAQQKRIHLLLLQKMLLVIITFFLFKIYLVTFVR